MKNIASKKDIIDFASGIQVFNEGSMIPDVGTLLFGIVWTNFEDFALVNFSEGDTITINGTTYTFIAGEPEGQEISIGTDITESYNNIAEILTNYVNNYDSIDISANMENAVYRRPIGSSAIVLSGSIVEGDTLTIGEVTYTFKETPTEQYDIDIADPVGNFVTFLNSNPNPIIIGLLLGEGYMFSTVDQPFIFSSSNDGCKVFKFPGTKTIDIHKNLIIFNCGDSFIQPAIVVPNIGVDGKIIKLINISDSVSLVSRLTNFSTVDTIGENNSMELVYIRNVGWRILRNDGTLFEPGFSSGMN